MGEKDRNRKHVKQERKGSLRVPKSKPYKRTKTSQRFNTNGMCYNGDDDEFYEETGEEEDG